jgi:outer membrane protein insertion porin family
MAKLFIRFLFLVALFSGVQLHAQVHYENLIVNKINVTVVNVPSDSEVNLNAIRSRMKTTEGSVFSQATFDSDLKQLIEEFDRVEPTVDIVGDQIEITLKVWVRPQIRSIQWEGNLGCDTDDLLKELGIKTGTVFDRMEFNRGFNKIKAFYVKKGYFEAEVDYELEFSEVCNDVDIIIQINEGRCGKIKKIVFENFTCEEEDCIVEKMVTKEYIFLFSFFTDEGIYNEDAVQQDQYLILNYLQNEGYADARVKIDVKEISCDRIMIVITADKGDLYTIHKLTFEGNTIFSDEQIEEQFTIEEGDPYSPEEVRASLLNVVEMYGRYGYIDAIVDFEPTLDPDCPKYSVHFTIEEGDQYRVGMIKIFGNCSTENRVILNECLLVPGEIFNTCKLKKTEQRLQNVGYFASVNVYAVKSEDYSSLGGSYRDVHIEVEETNTGNFSAFGGFSNIESIFGGITITEKNFNYKGLGNVFRDGYSALRGAGEYAYINATIGAKSRSYTLSWTKPYFQDTNWIVGFDLNQSNIRYVSNSYSFNTYGITVHAKYPLNDFLQIGTHYRFKNARVNVFNPDGKIADYNAKIIFEDHQVPINNDYIDELYDEIDSEQLIIQEASNSGIISAVGAGLFYNSLDCPRKPRQGFKSSLEVEFAGVGGKHAFIALGYTNVYYYPLSAKGTFKFRADNKFVIPCFGTTYHTMPIDERLFLGGDDTVRGFKSYSLGPQYPNTAPRGGLSLNMFTLEYNYSIWKKLDLFAFIDSGTLNMGIFTFNPYTFKTAYGFGVRICIYEGGPPVTLGLGFPLTDANKDDVRNFFFSMGGAF